MTNADSIAPHPRRDSYRDELNFAEFPIASLSDSLPSDQKTLVFTDEIVDRGRNERVTRKLTITASDEFGLPTAMDDEIMLGLIQLTNEGGFSDRKVHFTRYQLLKTLDWRMESKSYKRIEQSLKRWLGVTLYYEKAWWSKEEGCWVDESFHVLDQVTIFDRERRDRRIKVKSEDPIAGQSSFVWNEVVFNSFKAGYLKQLDFDLFKQLKSPISKRMYRFLDKRFYNRGRLEFDLKNFAFEKVGLSKNYHNGELKRHLEGAIKELEGVGFLTVMPKEERFIRKSRGEWSIIIQKAGKGSPLSIESGKSPEETSLIGTLTDRGVTRSAAAALVASNSCELIQKKIDIFDWLQKKADKRLSQNPAGFLVKSIQEDYAPPPEFLDQSKNKILSEAAKVRDEAKNKAFDSARAMQDRKATEERQALDQFWNAMTGEQQLSFEEEALQMTDKFFADQYYRGKKEGEGILFRTTRQAIIDSHIKRALCLMQKKEVA
jgi:hypothetical protein